MSSWTDLEQEEPELAAEVRRCFDAHVHTVVATVRADGSPRLCGSEVVFLGDDLYLAGMTGARRFADLRRDPRVAVHSCPEDMPGWSGDARLAGTASEVTDPAVHEAVAAHEPTGVFELFRVDLTEAVSVRLEPGTDGIVVELWRPGRGVVRTLRG